MPLLGKGPKAALKYLTDALELAKASPIDMARVENNLGIAYLFLNNPQQAWLSFQNAFTKKYSLYEDKKHPDIALSENNLGIAYLALENPEKDTALLHLKAALTIRESWPQYRNLHPDIARSHNNLGIAYLALGKSDEALNHLNQALEMRRCFYTNDHPSISRSLKLCNIIKDNTAYLVQEKVLEYLEPDLEMY